MVRRWSTTRSWLVVWELLALIALGVAINRYFRAAPVSYDYGVMTADWMTLMSMVRAAFYAAVCAVVGLVPAAWVALGPSRGSGHAPEASPATPSGTTATQENVAG